MQVTTDILLDAIFLLINDNSSEHKAAAQELIALYDDEAKVTEASDTGLARFYIRVIKTLVDDGVDRSSPDVMRSVLLKFKSDPVVSEHREVIKDLQSAFESRDTMDSDRLMLIFKNIQAVIIWHRMNKALKKSFSKLMRATEYADPELQLDALNEVKESTDVIGEVLQSPFASSAAKSQPFDVIDFSKEETVRTGMDKYVTRNVTSVLKTGLIGLNMMFGKMMGIPQGASVVFNALAHSYKSGILVSVAMWAVTCNTFITENGEKPMIYLASLENEAFENMMWVFRFRYMVETGQSADGMSHEDMIKWIMEYFARFNVAFVIERHLPSDFGYKEFVQRVSYYRALGYSIKLAVVDYANLMKMSSDDGKQSQGGRHLDVRRLYSNMVNFTKNSGITWITAHQLNRGAAELDAMCKSGQIQNVVKRLGPNFLMDSMDVEREVDISIYMYLEKNHQDQKFATFRINKHRGANDTPEAWKSCAYQFTDNGIGILDDVGGKPRYLRDIYVAEFDENNLTPPMPTANDNGQPLPVASGGLF